jgi:hypothetical protein
VLEDFPRGLIGRQQRRHEQVADATSQALDQGGLLGAIQDDEPAFAQAGTLVGGSSSG